MQPREPRPRRVGCRLRCGRQDRGGLLAGQEQLGHLLGRPGLCQDRQEQGKYVRRRQLCFLSSCLSTYLTNYLSNLFQLHTYLKKKYLSLN